MLSRCTDLLNRDAVTIPILPCGQRRAANSGARPMRGRPGAPQFWAPAVQGGVVLVSTQSLEPTGVAVLHMDTLHVDIGQG
jgi:hypothetical protein